MEMNFGSANVGFVPSSRAELVHTASQRSAAAETGTASHSGDESETTVVRHQTPKATDTTHPSATIEEDTPDSKASRPSTDSIESGRAVQLPLQGTAVSAIPVDQEQVERIHSHNITDFDHQLPSGAEAALQANQASSNPTPTPDAARDTASPLPKAPGAYPTAETPTPHEPEKRRPFSGLSAIAAAAAGVFGASSIGANTGKRLQKEPRRDTSKEIGKETSKEASKAATKPPPKAMAHWSGTRPLSETSNAGPEEDAPYIEFALDQLTRDEELLGRSRDRSGSPDIVPVDPEGKPTTSSDMPPAAAPATFVPSRGSTYHYTPMTDRKGTPERRDSKRLSKDTKRSSRSSRDGKRFSGASWRSRDSSHMTPMGVALAAPVASGAAARASNGTDISPVTSDDDVQHPSPLRTAREPHYLPVQDEPERRARSVSPISERPDEMHLDDRPMVPPKEKPIVEEHIEEPAGAHLEERVAHHPAEQPLTNLPITTRLPPHDLYRYPPLTYIPKSLRLPAVGILIVLVLVLIALITLSVVWSFKKDGLWPYDGIGTSRYFLAQYLPTLLAAVVIIYVQVMQTALQRILPFVLLSRKTHESTMGNVFHTVPLYISNYLLPNRSLFQSGEPILAYAAISFWLNLWTVPLASALYQTRLFPGGWCWTTVEPIGVVLLGLYLNLILAMLALHFRLRSHPTGLKWDPVSLADVLVLIRKTTESGSNEPLFNPQRASLGYWESSSQPGHFYHGLGASPSAPQLEIQRGKTVRSKRGTSKRQPAQASTFESWNATPSSGKLRPWFLRESMVALFAVIAVVLAAAFIVASYVRMPLGAGFDPRLPTVLDTPNTFSSFSPANFLYSFVPALIGLLAPLLWGPIDTAARYFAPYLALVHARRGVTTEGSLLLSYTADAPGVATVRAASHGDYFVAAASLLSLVSWALPILGGGLFSATFVRDAGIVMRADSRGLAALTAFVALVALGWVAVWPVAGSKLRGGWIAKGHAHRVHRGLGRSGRTKASEAVTPAELEKGTAPGAPGSGCLEEWLCGTDLRHLSGIHDALGEAVLAAAMWREPRTREDLVGRLIGRGRGRWSWMGVPGSGGGGIQRFE